MPDFGSAPDWYDAHADQFIEGAARLDCTPLLSRITRGLPTGARILDAGCGSGRDIKALRDMGFDVHGFDPSRAMREATKALTGHMPRAISFADYGDPAGSWDAIICMASLIHVPLVELPDTISRLWISIGTGGRLYMSFKRGSGEITDTRGRAMTELQPDSLLELGRAACRDAAEHDFWIQSAPASSGLPTVWLSLIMTRGA